MICLLSRSMRVRVPRRWIRTIVDLGGIDICRRSHHLHLIPNLDPLDSEN
jgi:hypothetical protein